MFPAASCTSLRVIRRYDICQARDATPEFQAVMPVRGKTLNCQNSSYEKIFKSEVILESAARYRLRR